MTSQKNESYPVIDLFAGPGGLGEGFSSLKRSDGTSIFHDAISIEKDPFSHQTLLLRHFFRSFEKKVPEDYYHYLGGKITQEILYKRHPKNYSKAQQTALLATLGEENSHETIKNKITSQLKNRNKWVLVGGPPCQAYSIVGRSRRASDKNFEADDRHFLYREYLKILADHLPPVFVMENVKGLLSAKIAGKKLITQIISDLSHPRLALSQESGGTGYKLYSLTTPAKEMADQIEPQMFVVKAEEYGVPQARHRMFIVGIRDDINEQPHQLQPEVPPTIKDIIGNMPKLRSGLSKGEDSAENWQNAIQKVVNNELKNHIISTTNSQKDIALLSSYFMDKLPRPQARSSARYTYNENAKHPVMRYIMDNRLKTLTSHETRGHIPEDLHRYFFASLFSMANKRSPKMCDFPHALLPAHKNVEKAKAGKMFADRFRVQLANRVATTVTSHISKDGHYYIHYDPLQCRSLTVREAARLQTFPDNYKFEGPRTAQYHQIGNAVPPYLANQIAKIIAKVLASI